jgi:hypothetical protein
MVNIVTYTRRRKYRPWTPLEEQRELAWDKENMPYDRMALTYELA